MNWACLLLLFASAGKTFACDFCGCYMGITPYDNQSSIMMMYRYKSYNGYYGQNQSSHLFPSGRQSLNPGDPFLKHGSSPSVTPVYDAGDYEIYSSAELRARYFIHRRLELDGILPVVVNSSRTAGVHEKVSGIGDITMMAAYHLVSRIETEKYQHRLIVGAGLKLPVGNYYATGSDGKRIDPMLQPGTGSVDEMVFMNYIFGVSKAGFSLNSMLKFNGDNYYDEHYGTSTTNYLSVFYKFRQDKDLKVFPSLQAYYEYSAGSYYHEKLIASTEMNVLTAGAGLDLFFKNLALNCSFQVPAYEKAFNGNLRQTCRATVGLTYNFSQSKYLLHSRKSA